MPSAPHTATPRWCVVAYAAIDEDSVARYSVVGLTTLGEQLSEEIIPAEDLAACVTRIEATHHPRWVWHDTASIYPQLLMQGVRVERCHDLRLCHQILRAAERVPQRETLLDDARWSIPSAPPEDVGAETAPALFEVAATERRGGVPDKLPEVLREFERQRSALAASTHGGGLGVLLAAESAGALIAAELTIAGVPWDVEEHDRILSDALGPRPPTGTKPEKMVRAGNEVRTHLGDMTANLDSAPKLLRSLRAAGIEVSSTSQWELSEHEHPAIQPLLHYKKLARLLSANGWVWLDEWVREHRYRPIYIPGGVVTGRWASSGGGALQIPRSLRPALRADDGWLLVSADVSQLEPRVLAAMSGDRAMIEAGAGKDLYAGIVDSGVVQSRSEAKIAVLGAMYGSTSGDSGRLVPKLRLAFPAAMQLVDDAAAEGERGGVVSTWLGRSSPKPDPDWYNVQSAASMPGASRLTENLAKRSARDRGRFTRNFVVQGTAAEWALVWMAELRQKLSTFAPVADSHAAHASGPVFAHHPHLTFFLHDEVIVHTPKVHADGVAQAVIDAAEVAGRRLFGTSPIDFTLDLHITERAQKD
ncbi:MAG: bifunctional 3'-5' exonuclease/DNA polymerase [Leucobacter sp.]